MDYDNMDADSNVEHPRHYNKGQYETIEIIEDQGWAVGFCCGNAIKYITRHQHKRNAIEDLKKARWYIDRLIDYYETEKAIENL